MRASSFVRFAVSFATLTACGSPMPSRDGAVTDVAPVPVESSELTYTLDESPAALPMWTTSNTHKVRTIERPPTARHSGLHLYAARREFEPVQIALGPATGQVTVHLDAFANLGTGPRTTIAQIGYDNGWAERLTPLAQDATITLDANAPAVLWITVWVPPDATPGTHMTTLTLTPAGGTAVRVPITLDVFNFTLPPDIHFDSQFNLGIQSLIPMGGTVDDAKTTLYEHRMTPASVTWPSGMHYSITWDNANGQCNRFWDEPTEQDMFAVRWLAPRYILGTGWNMAGFPSAMAFQFVDNSTPRPATFCNVSRGDHFGTAQYNTAWSAWLTGLQNWLVATNLINKTYYYVQNEPQNDEDHRLANALCRLTRTAAPRLRIAVSEEPTPAIAERPEGACGYDIWIAHVRAYEQQYAWSRQRDHNETVWFYSLDQDPDPYFNPTRTDRQGTHVRMIPWVSWHQRARGFAYYDAGRFFDGPRPGVRAELFREGFEDYEYLYLANRNSHPAVGTVAVPDPAVDSAASGLTSFTDDPDALAVLRRELGRFIEGSRTTVPVLTRQGSSRPRGSYYINFQNPTGQPTANPLVVSGHTYLKIGWQPFNTMDQYGWSGENIGNPAIALSGYDDVAGFNEAQKSYLYDDYGRDNRFEFGIENGRYKITVGAGRPARGYPGDPQNVTLEGMKIIDDVVTTNAAPTLTRNATIDITDGSITLIAGGRSRSTGNYAYTFMQYMDIEPVP